MYLHMYISMFVYKHIYTYVYVRVYVHGVYKCMNAASVLACMRVCAFGGWCMLQSRDIARITLLFFNYERKTNRFKSRFCYCIRAGFYTVVI